VLVLVLERLQDTKGGKDAAMIWKGNFGDDWYRQRWLCCML
jgi:hypothetical protein